MIFDCCAWLFYTQFMCCAIVSLFTLFRHTYIHLFSIVNNSSGDVWLSKSGTGRLGDNQFVCELHVVRVKVPTGSNSGVSSSLYAARRQLKHILHLYSSSRLALQLRGLYEHSSKVKQARKAFTLLHSAVLNLKKKGFNLKNIQCRIGRFLHAVNFVKLYLT